jgi:hypothetical protein
MVTAVLLIFDSHASHCTLAAVVFLKRKWHYASVLSTPREQQIATLRRGFLFLALWKLRICKK